MRPFAAAMALAVSAFLAAPLSAQSLADTLIAAYRNSNLLEQNRAVLRAADEDVAIAVASLRPVVNFVADAQQRFASSGQTRDSLTLGFSLSAEVTLIDFGRGKLATDAAKSQVLATRQALVDLEQDVLRNAISAHLDLRTAQEFVALREATQRVITSELNAARERFELGEVTRTDVSLAEAQLAGARAQLAAAQGDLAAARAGYEFVTGMAARQLAPPPALPRTAANLQTAQDIARRMHPRIIQAQHEVRAAELNAERVALQREGSVTATGSVGQQFSNRQSSQTSATLGLRYARPIYQGGQLNALARQANARRDAARAGLHQTVAQVVQNVAVAWSNLDVSRAQITASQQQIRAAQSAFEGTREEANLGARTTLDVLNAEANLRDARAQLVRAQANEQLATYSVLATMGLLTVEHLGLGIPTYDVEAYYGAVRNAPATSAQGEALDRVLRSIGRQ